MSLAFANVSTTSPGGVQSARGLLYLIVSEVVFTHSYAVFHTFPAELPVFLREKHLYSSSAFYVAKALSTVSASQTHGHGLVTSTHLRYKPKLHRLSVSRDRV